MAEARQSFRDFEQAGWEDAGICRHYHESLSTVTTQSVEALLDAAGVRAGSRLLDVATGVGYIAAAGAQRGAEAVGVDFSSTQIRMARERYPALRFEPADADALPFPAASFEALTNGFGMCHVADPGAALREAFRVLKSGGRIAFTVWDGPERAVGIGAAYIAIRAHGAADVGLPMGPNFFLFSDPEQSRQALTRAGFVSPSLRQVPQVWHLTDPDSVFTVLIEGTVRTRAALRAQSASATEAIKTAIRDAVAPYRRGDRYEVPMPAALSTAVKP
jgi:ubiquinone/menaquinone biosynthesis C-methylase UbiE